MSITVKQLKEKLEEYPDDWELWAYEGSLPGEGVGISLKAPDVDWSKPDWIKKTGWIATGADN